MGDDKKQRTELDSMDSLTEAYFSGNEAELEKLLSPYNERAGTYAVARETLAPQVIRTDAVSNDTTTYRDISPPAAFGAPYCLMYVYFEPKEKTYFMYHAGEEILIPISGKITYNFVLPTQGASDLQPKTLPAPLEPNDIIRIQPSFPHHTWATGGERAEALMVWRDISEDPVKIKRGASYSGAPNELSHRLFFLGQVPGARPEGRKKEERKEYAMVFSGLGEIIGLRRNRAGLTFDELAELCSVDRGYLSKVEAGEVTPSLPLLGRIGEALSFNPFERFSYKLWKELAYQRSKIPILNTALEETSPAPISELCSTEEPHFLHLRVLSVGAGCSKAITEPKPVPFGSQSSWFVRTGEVLFQVMAPPFTREFLEKGNVIHLRKLANCKIQALKDSQLLEIRYSSICTSASSK